MVELLRTVEDFAIIVGEVTRVHRYVSIQSSCIPIPAP